MTIGFDSEDISFGSVPKKHICGCHTFQLFANNRWQVFGLSVKVDITTMVSRYFSKEWSAMTSHFTNKLISEVLVNFATCPKRAS